MITKQTNKNKPIYDELYKEINQFLYGKESSEDEHLITDLNDYFHVLPELISHMNEPGFKPKFIILPVDEDLFEINANTREIIVPASFRKGAGVVGDQAAEIIYFSIDRYFDTMDLNNQNIYIEWIGPKGQDGVSQELIRDTSKPGKIIFGWALHNEITQDPGTVEFAIRFWSKNKTSGEIEYVLRTLPQRITINNGLNLDSLEDDKNIFDEEKQRFIFNRIVKSVLDDNINKPESAKVLTLYYTYENGMDEEGNPIIKIENIKDKVIDEKKYEFKMTEHPDGKYTLYVSAGSARGILKYLLKVGGTNYTASRVYKLTLDEKFNNSKVYYIKNENEEYQVYVSDSEPTKEDLENFYEELYVFKFFKKESGNTLDTDIIGVGKFELDVTNRIGLETTPLEHTIIVEKPGPANPTKGWGDDNFKGVVFKKDATSESKVILKLNEEKKPIYKENEEETTYKWYEERANEEDIELDNTLSELSIGFDEVGNEKIYKVYPINKLNGVYTPKEEITPFRYRVTKYPQPFDDKEQVEFIKEYNDKNQLISVKIVPTNKIFSDSLKYQVYYSKNQNATLDDITTPISTKLYPSNQKYELETGAYKFVLYNVVNGEDSDPYIYPEVIDTYIGND